jgi:molybdopterin-guanine dinucleotide biosynthesis protein A
MSRRRVSAIVLAGGRSSRFGRDKLAEPIDGKALLDHAIDAVRPTATEVIVVVAPDGAPTERAGVRVVRDSTAFEGPLAGLLAGLEAAREPAVLVTGGDMPDLSPAVAEVLLAELDASRADVVVLEDGGRPRPLPMAIDRDAGRAVAQRLIGAGERRLRAIVEALASSVVAEGTWRALDPGGGSLRDIDTPDDLP